MPPTPAPASRPVSEVFTPGPHSAALPHLEVGKPHHLMSWQRDRDALRELALAVAEGWIIFEVYEDTGVVWLGLPVELCRGGHGCTEHG